MSTTALLICKNNEGNYNAIAIRYDGYINGGVGEILYKNWNNAEENHELCSLNKFIRCFGYKFEDIEFFEDNYQASRFIYELKNMTYDDMINQCGNYDYSYYWDDAADNCRGAWLVYNNEHYKFELLKNFIKNINF